MIPVQARHHSDCVAAALAAILEIPIEEMPDFWRGGITAAKQWDLVRRWLNRRGYHWYYSTYGGDDCPRLKDFAAAKTEAGCSFPPQNGYWIALVSSVDRLRDNDPEHTIVMKGRKPVFNPSGTVKQALDGPWFVIGYHLLIPLDPTKLALVAE